MGGRALKKTFTRRYEKEEYHQLCEELLPKLAEIFDTEVSLVESFKHKETFGDMDVLVLGRRDNNKVKEILIKAFNPPPGQIYCNIHVVSFEHKELQIDLIFTKESQWESSKLFFKYGDLGNLLGKMYHKINLKYGFEGLKMVIRDLDDTKKLGEFIISTDGEKIFEFMGLSWDRYLQGFDNEQEIFDYIIQSRFFDPEAFKFENLNHINRKRNRRRKGYGEFVKFVEEANIKSNYTFDETDKTKHIQEIEEYFDVKITDEINRLQQAEKLRQEIAGKFDGRKVMEWGEIDPGPEVAKHIEGFKNHISEEKNYNQYMIEKSQEEIKSEFLKYFQNI